MTTDVALALAGLIVRLAAAAPLAAPPAQGRPDEAGAERAGARSAQRPPASEGRGDPASPQDVRIEGDVTYQPGTGRLLVENGAVLRRGAVTIRARSATYDPASGEVRATGGVLLTDATRAVSADAIRAVLDGDWEADGVVAFVKDQPLDLGGAETIEAARRGGRNRLSFSGSRLRGDASGRLRLDGARLTLCDCPGDCPPSWEVTATKADVVPGERAILSWPVLRITPRFLFVNRPVPVLALPWLYVPLGDRQTGLLLPEVRRTEVTGFALAEPLFVALGRSADATLTAEYAFGPGRVDPPDAAIRGPGARLELRWAPAAGAQGHVEVAWLHDLDHEPLGEGGDRFAITGAHGQRLSERTSLAGRLRLAGDPVWVRDLTSDVNGRKVTYRRSDLLLSHRRDALVLEAGADHLQPLRPDGVVPGQGYGPFGADAGVASRWPGVSASLLPVAAGPLRISAHAAATRYAPVSGAFDQVARPSAERADVRAEVTLPLLLGGAVSLAPYLRGSAAGYAFEAPVDPRASAWGVAGAVVGTEVSRRLGSVRHAIAPRLEWRAGTAPEGAPPAWLAYDAYDRTGAGLLSAGPPGAWQQLRGALATRLSRGATDLVRLEAGQDLDLRAGRFAESFASGAVSVGRFGADASARFLAFDGRADPSAPSARIPSPLLDRFTELHANVSLADRRGASVRAGFFAVGPGGSGTLVAGIDPLFDLRAAPLDAAAGASAGARVVLGGATLGYDALFPGRATFAQTCTGGPGTERRVGAWQAQQHVASFAWDSPCRCFRVAAVARVTDCGELSATASFDLSRLAAVRQRP